MGQATQIDGASRRKDLQMGRDGRRATCLTQPGPLCSDWLVVDHPYRWWYYLPRVALSVIVTQQDPGRDSLKVVKI